ncbi:hypothetical protein [Nocardia australiensis]|nr:hypothetical protein [Nocardia australiensis]
MFATTTQPRVDIWSMSTTNDTTMTPASADTIADELHRRAELDHL